MVNKITFLGPAYPYRGGIATIIETLAHEFGGRGCRVDVKTFTVQYPALLFPGKSQYRTGEPPVGLDIVRCVSTVDPMNWRKVGKLIRREKPDVVVVKYWTPFMAPALGTIARIARKNGHTKFIVQLDNITPHEKRWFDDALTRYFVNSMDGFIYMSHDVGRDLAKFDTTKPRLYSPHPMFDHFGERMPKDEACRQLGLDPEVDYVMFFGLVRAYKGLDLLLQAWARMKKEGKTENKKLIVAGDFYDDISKYGWLIATLGLHNDVVIHDRFVPDDQVRLYFSLADLLVLPYKTATQSGVTQIAYGFDLPMVVSNVGGLPEIVPDGVVGFVAEPSPESIAAAIEKFYSGDNASRLRANFAAEKIRFSWPAAADAIEKLYTSLQL